ncbi:MAG: hypothetical protein HYZ71_13980 [Deltaproteobacteria bacterium]|nr:hypothetical protein [Deltaproteobacteria bacterium]
MQLVLLAVKLRAFLEAQREAYDREGYPAVSALNAEAKEFWAEEQKRHVSVYEGMTSDLENEFKSWTK